VNRDSEPEDQPLAITSVQYSRLFGLGNYENEKVGASCQVQEDEDPKLVLNALKAWINQQGRDLQRLGDVQESIAELGSMKADLELQLTGLHERFERVTAFLEKHGIDTSRYTHDPDYPFS